MQIKLEKSVLRSARLWIHFFSCLCIFWSLSAAADSFWSFKLFAKDEPIVVTVNDAFINVHNGVGEGYPIFYVVERGEKITLLKMRTDWIKIKTARGLTGWIERKDVLLTLGPDGKQPDFPDTEQADYLVDRTEFGAAYADFAGAKGIDLNLGYRFTRNITAEIRFADNTGEFSDSRLETIGILHQPFPDWYISPYFGLAVGKIRTFPSATLVRSEDRLDSLYQTNLGAYIHITGRFFLRIEATNDYILTSRNTNEEVKEWKAGFSVFF